MGRAADTGLVHQRPRAARQGFRYQASPRRAHSIAAQRGINAAKNYRNDGESVLGLFYDVGSCGDFRRAVTQVSTGELPPLARLSSDVRRTLRPNRTPRRGAFV